MRVSLEELQEKFTLEGYIINEEALNTIYLALKLEKPLLICGPPGVGKTELARVLSKIFHAKLIRLQCHEGLDENKALYDWNFQRQLVKIHLTIQDRTLSEEKLFSLSNILQKPLLQAIMSEKLVVFLIDEIDRADPEFEGFLLEVLSDFQISVPEIGTITARQKPVVLITNNGERELTEALKRRCVFLHLDFPSIEQEASIIKAQIPEILANLREEITLAIASVQSAGGHLGFSALHVLDWARTLLLLDADRFQKGYVEKTLKLLAKIKENIKAYWEKT